MEDRAMLLAAKGKVLLACLARALQVQGAWGLLPVLAAISHEVWAGLTETGAAFEEALANVDCSRTWVLEFPSVTPICSPQPGDCSLTFCPVPKCSSASGPRDVYAQSPPPPAACDASAPVDAAVGMPGLEVPAAGSADGGSGQKAVAGYHLWRACNGKQKQAPQRETPLVSCFPSLRGCVFACTWMQDCIRWQLREASGWNLRGSRAIRQGAR